MPYGYTQPSNWGSTRTRILDRDEYACYICGQPNADEVDHVLCVAEGGTHDDSNLAAIHKSPCHEAKTKAEQARGRTRRRLLSSKKLKTEAHPGAIAPKKS